MNKYQRKKVSIARWLSKEKIFGYADKSFKKRKERANEIIKAYEDIRESLFS